MFDRLIELVIEMIDKIIPFWVIPEYDNGVLLTFGKYTKTLGPGFHWKLPFAQEILTHHVVTALMSIPQQSLTTKDGKQIVVKVVIKYKVEDVKPLLLEVFDSSDAISDITQAIVKKQIHIRSWQECLDEDIDNEIAKKLRVEVKKWGIYIESVTMTDMGITKSLRLYNDKTKNKEE